ELSPIIKEITLLSNITLSSIITLLLIKFKEAKLIEAISNKIALINKYFDENPFKSDKKKKVFK
ncbi:hypothetical protein OFB51_27550, partial [Escherichia coli]|nr:hypothetical protein [Escherichia coli]